MFVRVEVVEVFKVSKDRGYAFPGEVVECDPDRASAMVRKGYAKRVEQPRRESRIAPGVPTEVGDLSGDTTPEKMTVRELKEELRKKGVTIPHNARRSELVSLFGEQQ